MQVGSGFPGFQFQQVLKIHGESHVARCFFVGDEVDPNKKHLEGLWVSLKICGNFLARVLSQMSRR